MDNEVQRYNKFIEKLIEQTKANTIEWEFLDEENFLSDIFSDYRRDFSYCFYKDNSYVVLTTGSIRNELSLHVVPDNFRAAKSISGNEYEKNLTRLSNTISKQFPNPDDFIDAFINSEF